MNNESCNNTREEEKEGGKKGIVKEICIGEKKVFVILKGDSQNNFFEQLNELLKITCEEDADFQTYSLKNPNDMGKTVIVQITGFTTEKLKNIYQKVVNLK